MSTVETHNRLLRQVRIEKRRTQRRSLLYFPLGTAAMAILFAWLLYWVFLPLGVYGPPTANPETVVFGFIRWGAHVSDNFGPNSQPGALLFALAALSIAMFLTLTTATPPPESRDTIISRANRMVMDEFSMLVAGICAVLAWLTLLTLDLEPESIPDAVAAVGTAWLCSATIPLHQVRADVHRFTLLEAQEQQRSFGTLKDALKHRDSRLARFSRRRCNAAYSLWTAPSALAAALLFLICTLAGDNRAGILSRVIAFLLVLGIAAVWAFVTQEMCLSAVLDWTQKQRFTACVTVGLYVACAITGVFLSFWLLSNLAPLWLAIPVALCGVVLPFTAYLLDKRLSRLGLLTGIQRRRISSRIHRLGRTVKFSKRQLVKNTVLGASA